VAERVLVDSSAWVEAMRKRGDPAARSAVADLLRIGAAVICDFVRLELWNGARGPEEKAWLRELEESVETLETTEKVWEEARDLARRCRSKGITIPSGDLLIAACASEHRTGLLHRDSHFDRLKEI
jgi:predicted nucleic acid-binding protein